MLKEVGHTVTHPGKGANDPPIIIDVPKDLVTEPGVPTRDEDVSFYSRDYPGNADIDRKRFLRLAPGAAKEQSA